MTVSLPFMLDGADDQPIYGDTHLPDGDALGIFVICHGFKGYKDYGFMPWLAARAVQRGFIVHRFNFSHSGMTNRIEIFERPDLFERDTWGKQIYDLHQVASAVRQQQLPGGELPMIWFGHSRGGVTAVLAANRAMQMYPGLMPVAIIVAAAPARSCSLDENARHLLRKNGYLDSPSSRTKQTLRVGRAWLAEQEADPQAFDPLLAAAHLSCPLLIVHGSMDATVPVEAAHAYARAAANRAELHIITNGNHVFNGRNPMPADQPPADQLVQMADVTLAFSEKWARGNPSRDRR